MLKFSFRWLTFLREQKEAQEEEKQFQAYWERRHQEDKDLWRDKVKFSSQYKTTKLCNLNFNPKPNFHIHTIC